jgi:hypothetical protein
MRIRGPLLRLFVIAAIARRARGHILVLAALLLLLKAAGYRKGGNPAWGRDGQKGDAPRSARGNLARCTPVRDAASGRTVWECSARISTERPSSSPPHGDGRGG